VHPLRFLDLPHWESDDHLEAFRAFCGSAPAVLSRAGSEGSPLAECCRRALDERARISTAEGARAFFEREFVPARPVHSGPPGLLTGYYEPVLEGSITPDAQFTVPLFARPPDLENVVPESERSAQSEGYSHLRRTAAGLEPYATREDIERGALSGRGLELLYLVDRIEAFFLHVQGSGAIRLRDGRIQRVTYDGKNGHPYTSVGRTLIEEGAMPAEGLTLQTLTGWLAADPARARGVLWRNKSFVFFRLLDGGAPIGVLGTALHPLRSLAVDPAFHALGGPVYVCAPAMTHVGASGFNRLMVAHDVGSAIKGPERGDIFYGTGEAALAGAGITKHPGAFYVLQPRGGS